MNEMIERVAKVIDHDAIKWDCNGDDKRRVQIVLARAAIEAMREPDSALKLDTPDPYVG